MTEILCDLIYLRGTPLFALDAPGKYWKRVLGATFVRKTGTWLFPAFYPYCADVVRDLEIVQPELRFTPKAEKHIDATTQLSGRKLGPTVPDDFQFMFSPYAHQKEGLAFVQRYIRAALFFDMGLGKTKIIYDLLRIEKLKALVLSPSVGIGTWLNEAERHAPELDVQCLLGKTQAGKKAHKERKAERDVLKEKIKNAEGPERDAYQRDLDAMLGPAQMAKLADIKSSSGADVLIVTYDTAKLYEEAIFDGFDYDTIIADESQALRGPNTGRTKAALALSSKANRRIIMTGTPSLGNPLHLYGQLAFLGKYIPAVSQWVFRKHHIVFAKGSRKIQVGFKNLDMLNDKVHRVALVRDKDECLDLPDRTVVDVPFTLGADQKKMYNSMVERAVTDLGNGMLYDPDNAATVLQKLLQILSGFIIVPPPPVCDGCKNVRICVETKIRPYTPACPKYPDPWPRKIQRFKSNPKLDALNELLDGILEKDKAIVWAFFTEELNMVEENLKERGVGYIRIDGSNSHKAAKESQRFNEDPEIKVWLAQITTGVALTLTAAAYTVYFGLTYRLDDYLQSMDRNYRIGQKQATFVYRLISPGSAGEFVGKALAAKLNLAETLTTRIDCVLCSEYKKCLKSNVEPFGKGCRYKSRVNRVITKPKKL